MRFIDWLKYMWEAWMDHVIKRSKVSFYWLRNLTPEAEQQEINSFRLIDITCSENTSNEVVEGENLTRGDVINQM